MLVKFHSKAAADVLMYEQHAEPILRMLNKDPVRGIITAEQTAGAIAMLGNMAMFMRGPDGRGPGMSGILAMIFAPLAAGLVQMAISRTREFEADREGAEISGQPMMLASALAKIASAAGRTVNIPAERNPASAAMFIVNPLSGMRLDRMFATHPATEDRIMRLRAMAG